MHCASVSTSSEFSAATSTQVVQLTAGAFSPIPRREKVSSLIFCQCQRNHLHFYFDDRRIGSRDEADVMEKGIWNKTRYCGDFGILLFLEGDFTL